MVEVGVNGGIGVDATALSSLPTQPINDTNNADTAPAKVEDTNNNGESSNNNVTNVNKHNVTNTQTNSQTETSTTAAQQKELSEDDLLLSHVVPPSQILPDGRFIRLPPPTPLESSAFFERAVAAHRLISGDGDEPSGGGGSKANNRKRQQKEGASGEGNAIDNANAEAGDAQQQTTSLDATSSRTKKKSKKAADAPSFVHPIAVASARLNAKGIDELSKGINLGSLVVGGEYFALTNIVNQRLIGPKATDAADGGVRDGNKGKDSGAGADNGNAAANGSASTSVAGASIDEPTLLDQRLRSKYVLRRRQTQYDNASTVLSRHERRLSSSLAVRRILDARLRSLRRQWRLVAPEHGTRTVGPVRPREVVAVDVEVYDRDRLGGGSRAVDDATGQMPGHLGRIARRVPRFATMELDNDYDVSEDIYLFRQKIKNNVVKGLKNGSENVDEGEEGGQTPKIDNTSADTMDVDDNDAKGKPKSDKSPEEAEVCKTKAEPFAIADPTLGKIDPDFDPDKVPLLTLLFEIEKPSTGYVQRATLSSSFSLSNGDNGSDGNNKLLHPDERVIEALQHSLFCASLFESMRAEIIPVSTSNNVSAAASSQQQQQQQLRHKSVSWLSSEMEESFLPPPSVMAGEDTSRSGEARLLCVIHCHEGEVKVQLDDEYSLTVKLIEAGTAAAAATNDSSNKKSPMNGSERSDVGGTMNTQNSNGISGGDGSSGSQSPAQLQILCRALLLHSQSLYHEHRMKTRKELSSSVGEKNDKPAIGFARVKKEVKTESPHILQSCVGLGCKFISEKKVRMVMKVSH